MDGKRFLVVAADDFGIGPATSQGILDLAARERVTCAVLLVNSPHAESAVQAWRRSGVALELGWHPCLTLDRPVLPAGQVPSLVGPEGNFWPLHSFLRRLWLGRVQVAEVESELRAQHDRFHALVGHAPTVVNAHHHVHVFQPVAGVLRHLLGEGRPLPYLRRVREPWRTLTRIPGARGKRAFLSALGRREASHQAAAGFPGNDWLAGITDAPCVTDPNFLVRWLTRMPGDVVELTCHPGHFDRTLAGRDCAPGDEQMQRRVHEFHLLQQPSFREACRQAHFTLVSPSELRNLPSGGQIDAA